MECKNCGIELTPGKRFCPGCGLPVADATAKPAAEEEESVVELRKRMIELKPFVAAFEKEKAEERKRREEERIKAEEAAVKALWSSKDLESLFDFDDDEEDELFDSIDVVDIEEEEKERALNLENLYPSDVYDFMHELDGSKIRMFGYMNFMRIDYDSIQVSLEDEDSDLSCIIDLNATYTDRSGNLISSEELPAILKSLKGSGIIFVSGRVEVEDDAPIIQVSAIENCLLGVKKLDL